MVLGTVWFKQGNGVKGIKGVKTVNEDVWLHALVDGKKVILNEASIRRNLRLDDAEGTACLPNAAIFEELATMSAKTSVWNEFSSTMASAIICLTNNQKFNFSKYIFEMMMKNLDVGVKYFMYSRFVQVLIYNQLGDMSHHKGIFVNPSLTTKVFANMKRVGAGFSGAITHLFETMMVQDPEEVGEIPTDSQDTPILTQPSSSQPQRHEEEENSWTKRLYKVGLSTRVESSKEEEGLGDQKDASKQGRIAEIDAKEYLSLINETAQDQGRMNKEDLFRVHDLEGDEVIVDITAGENVEQDATVAENETLIKIKAAKPRIRRVIVQDPSEFRTTTCLQSSQLPQAKDKDKGIMVEPMKSLKKKDQIAINEEIARKLEAQMKAKMEEEERIAREKVNTFVDMNTEIVEKRSKKTQLEVTKGGSKRARDEIEQESAKKQRLEKKDDSTELKRCLEIVLEDDDDVTIEATTLSSKSPTINFNREDLEVLRSIVKEIFKKTKPVDGMDNLLFQILKTMFKHHVEDNIWKYQQGEVKECSYKEDSKNPLKQQYENFTAPSSKMLDQTFDRLQKFISQLELLEEKLSQEDVIQKLLRSLSPEWNTHVVVWRNKANLDTMSMDDIYNNLKLWCHVMVLVDDWSDQAEEGPNYALMAFSSLSSDSKVSNDSTCLKSCLETIKLLKSQNDQLLKDLKKSELMVLEDIKVLKVEIKMREIAIRELKKKLEIAQKEKDDIQLNVDKFKHASKSLNKLVDCQIGDNCKKGLSYEKYNVVPPPYTGNFMPPTPDLSFTGLDKFVNKHVVENCKAKFSKEELKVVRKNDDALIIKEWVLDNVEEDVSQPKLKKNS
nr:hypothetical protein [Tanacetum cinerariifolium]